MSDISPSGRIVVVGAGMVGATISYALLNQQIAESIYIIDIAKELVAAQTLDLRDASSFSEGTKVHTGGYQDIQDGDIIVVTAGKAQEEGQTRLDLIDANVKIMRSIASEIRQTGKQVYIIVVANPVDILTKLAIEECNLPRGLVFGTGTYLDTVRLRVELSQRFNVSPESIHAYILGEHGDSSFPYLSGATVGGTQLSDFMEVNEAAYQELSEIIRSEAYKIISGKGATYYGIASAVAKIIKSILRDESRIIPLSVNLAGHYSEADVSIGVPAVIGKQGVKIMKELVFNGIEQELFNRSVGVMMENLKSIKVVD